MALKVRKHAHWTIAEIEHEYHVLRLTIKEIAVKHGISYRAIWQAMVRHGIERRSRARRDQRGERNPNWLGEQAGYFGLHKRLRRQFGDPQQCDNCKTTDPNHWYEWANLTGRFSDPTDYKRLCKSCHSKLDGKISNITGVPCSV